MPETMAGAPTFGPEHPRLRPVAERRARFICALSLAAVLVAAVYVAVTARRPGAPSGHGKGVRLLTVDRPFPAQGRYPSDPYIGSRVCAECHPGESALHSLSGHARTLRPAGRRALARQLDGTRFSDPEYPDVLWSYQYRDGQLHILRTDQAKVEDRIAEYAFGSGQHATTFVSVIDPKIPAILEHRITHYTQTGTLGLTPGQNARPRSPGLDSHGGMISARNARKCFGCHTTQTSAREDLPIDEATLIPNVTCERRHGPARAHVETARRNSTSAELRLPFGPDRSTAEGLLMLCGTCHRHPSKAQPGQIRPDDPHLARFQPVGILESRCFRESNGAFSCVTCHDPHARASSDRASYFEHLLVLPWGKRFRRPADRRRDPVPRRAARRLRRVSHAARRSGPARPLHRPLDPDPAPGESMLPLRGPART